MSGRTTYDCHACGAQVEAQARRCAYCAAPVATVRCATCFHMNVPEAGFCSGCGRELGLEPVGEDAALPCPVCKVALVAYREPDGSIFDCAQCGGQFVEHGLLRSMLASHARPAGVIPAPRTPAAPDPRNSYVPCPVCASLMNRKNFGATSGVIVDVCKKHGTFFDLGELPRVLAFVAAGGLDAAHARVAAEEAHRREARAGEAAHAPSSLRGASVATDGFGDVLLGLLLH